MCNVLSASCFWCGDHLAMGVQRSNVSDAASHILNIDCH